MTAAGGAAFSAFLADVLDDSGFYPGLKARPHAGTAAEFIALCDREPEDAFEEPEDDELRQWLGLEVELSRRREEAEIEAEEVEAEAVRRSPRTRPRALSQATADPSHGNAVADTGSDRQGGGKRPGVRRAAKSRNPGAETAAELTAKGTAGFRRLAAERREVEAFTPGNGVQRRLVGLLRSILGYMERNLCKPGQAEELDRWWRCVGAFRRALDFPELAGPRRRIAYEKLMELDAERLVAVARKGRMDFLMPKKKKRRGARGPEWRRYV